MRSEVALRGEVSNSSLVQIVGFNENWLDSILFELTVLLLVLAGAVVSVVGFVVSVAGVVVSAAGVVVSAAGVVVSAAGVVVSVVGSLVAGFVVSGIIGVEDVVVETGDGVSRFLLASSLT